MFVDNAGADILLGMIPLARYAARNSVALLQLWASIVVIQCCNGTVQ